MKPEDRELLRRFAATSIYGEAFAADVCRPSPLGTVTCSIERREGPMQHLMGQNLQLSVTGETGTVRYIDRQYRSEKKWECACDAAVVRRELGRLERYGLWELNDFEPEDTFLLHASHMFVRGCDPAREFSVDAVLIAASCAQSPFMRSFSRAAFRLLRRDRSHFENPPRPWRRLFDW